MKLPTPITNVVLVFDQNDSCSLRSGVTVTKMNIKTGKFHFETISAIETVLGKMSANDIKNSDSLNFFIDRINKWAPDNCPCYISRNFIKNLGYL